MTRCTSKKQHPFFQSGANVACLYIRIPAQTRKQGDGKHVLLKYPHSNAIPKQGDIKQTSNAWRAKLFIIRNQVSRYRGPVFSARNTTQLDWDQIGA